MKAGLRKIDVFSIVGWSLLLAYLTMIPLNGTAFPLVIQKLFGDVLQFGYLYTIAGYPVYLGEIFTSSFIVVLFAIINIKGLKKTSKVQNAIIFSLVTLIFSVFIGMYIKVDKSIILNNYIYNYEFKIDQVLRVLAITPFAFVGFDSIPQIISEFNFSAKSASFIAVISLLMASVMYNLLNIISGLAYSPSQASALDWALGSGVLDNLGRVGFILLVIALSAAVTSGINGFILCTSKLMGSIANYKMLTKEYGLVNENGVFQKTEVEFRKALSILGVIISITFIGLLLIPGSPAALGKESLIALGAWISLGGIFYKKVVD